MGRTPGRKTTAAASSRARRGLDAARRIQAASDGATVTGILLQPSLQPIVRPLVLLAVVLACCAPRAAAQVPMGHALCVTRGVNPGGDLLLFEPLRGGATPIDTTALGSLRLSVAIPTPGGIILAASTSTVTDDVLLRAAMSGNTVLAPAAFVQGLRGRAIALLQSPASGDLLVATTLGLFAAPPGGGTARPLTASVATMANTHAALLDRTVLVTSGADQSATPGLWLFDVVGQRLSFVPLRLPTPLALATGPAPGTLLLGDSTGQVWAYEVATQIQTPFARLGNTAIQALFANPDQRHWLAATPGSVHVFQGSAAMSVYPVPGSVWGFAYRAYASAVTLRGAGCQGTGPRPPELAALGRPTPGNTAFALTLAHAPSNTLAILILGGDRIDVGLDVFGMTGCRLYTTPLITLGVSTGATGGAQYPLPIPPDASLVGGGIEAQWVVRDLGANPASFTTTNAGSLGF